jgi:hypothetical protein
MYALITIIMLLFAPASASAGDTREAPFQTAPRQVDETATAPEGEAVCLLPGDEEALLFTKWEGSFWNKDHPNYYRGTISMVLAASWVDGNKRIAANMNYDFPDIGKKVGATYARIAECELRVEYPDIPEIYSLEKQGDKFFIKAFVRWGPKQQHPIQIEMKHVVSPPYLPFVLVRPVPEISTAPASQPSTAEITQ